VAALYPAVWSVAQIGTGRWSDTVGRKPLIAAGMLIQAGALALLALSDGALALAAVAAVALGLGTALVYPTLIAAISDAVSPVARAPVVGVYRFWRDSGYVLGGLIAGATADALGYGGAIGLVAGLTAASGLWVLRDMPAAPGLGHRPQALRQPAAAAAPPDPL
jgi:MFS family permease